MPIHKDPLLLGDDGGLILCSWPKGGKLSLPFVYSDEVWTGIEYQVAAHLMLLGEVESGLEIVRACRDRYVGKVRNPFYEYECGHWYVRAMSSYGMLQALTGVRYDAVEQTLYIDSKIGDFTSFLSTELGFGTVTLSKGKPALKVFSGSISVKQVMASGRLHLRVPNKHYLFILSNLPSLQQLIKSIRSFLISLIILNCAIAF